MVAVFRYNEQWYLAKKRKRYEFLKNSGNFRDIIKGVKITFLMSKFST